MRGVRGIAICGAGLAVAILLTSGRPQSAVAQADPPPGYIDVPGTPDVPLNSAHEDTVGSEFNQDCTNLNPDPPGPGEVGWHFVLPQSVVEERAPGGRPGNIFADLTVTFEAAGMVHLIVFGPPSDAHAYFTTPTDDTLLSGAADIFRLRDLVRGNETDFNLGDTCAPPGQPTSTTTTLAPTTTTSTTTTLPPTTTTLAPTTTYTTTTTTTSPTTTTLPPTTTTLPPTSPTTTTLPSTTTTSSTTTLAPTTTTSTTSTSTTTTLDPGTTTTISASGPGVPTTTISGSGPVMPTTTISGASGQLPSTGGGSWTPLLSALVAVLGGVGLILLSRRGESREH